MRSPGKVAIFCVVLALTNAFAETRQIDGERSSSATRVQHELESVTISSFDAATANAGSAFNFLQRLMIANGVEISMLVRLSEDRLTKGAAGIKLSDVSIAEIINALCERYDLWWKIKGGLVVGSRATRMRNAEQCDPPNAHPCHAPCGLAIARWARIAPRVSVGDRGRSATNMQPDWNAYPFSLFTDVAGHYIGRIFLLLSTLALAIFIGSGVAASTGEHIGWLGGLMIYPFMVIGGIAQIWGIFVYLILGVFTAVYLQRDIATKWLGLPFLLQGVEAYRWCASWDVGTL